MSLPHNLLDLPADESTRWIAMELLAEARKANARLASATDNEALHDFRVAIRRLRSLSRAHARHLDDAINPKRRKQLRRLQRMTGAARDTEVQRAWVRRFRKELSPAERRDVDKLIARFDRTLRGAMDGVPKAVRELFGKLEPRLTKRLESRVVFLHERVESYGAVLGGLARGHVAELATLLESISGLKDQEGIHTARIAGKRLRYLLEPARSFAPGARDIVKELKVLQDLLGDLHDMHVLTATLSNKKTKSTPGIDALMREARANAKRCFNKAQQRFSGEKLEELVRAVDALARGLDKDAPPLEIERKYLLRSLPTEVTRHPVKELAQGYLPGAEVRERLRRVQKGDAVHYLRTIKAGRGLVRIEVEEETPADVFDVMWPLTEGSRVIKRRYVVPEGDLVWEIDEFLDRELVLAEVELPHAELVPAIPEWLAPHVVREVTDEDTYVNVNLAK